MLVDLERSEVPWCCDVVTLEAVTILFFFHLWWMSVLTVSWDLWFSFLEILVYVEFFFLLLFSLLLLSSLSLPVLVLVYLLPLFFFTHHCHSLKEDAFWDLEWPSLRIHLKLMSLLLLLYSSVLWYVLFRCCVLPICLSTY